MSELVEPPFTKPFLILCEGRGDVGFLNRLIEKRELPAHFDIRNSYKNSPSEGGLATFGRYLANRRLNEAFMKMRAVLIISDNDDVDTSFGLVRDQLELSNGFPIPEHARGISSVPGFPAVSVYMLPHNESGNLETVCLKAAYTKWPLQGPVDAFIAATPAKDWPVGYQAKSRMQSLLSVVNDVQPDTGFGAHWGQDEQHRTPVENTAFDDIAQFLEDFPELVTLAGR